MKNVYLISVFPDKLIDVDKPLHSNNTLGKMCFLIVILISENSLNQSSSQHIFHIHIHNKKRDTKYFVRTKLLDLQVSNRNLQNGTLLVE